MLWSLFAIGVTCGFGLFYGISHEWFGDMPTFEELENPSTNLASEIISADGKILGTYYIENRSNVSYSELSPHLVEAHLAIEDIRFYEHSGIDQRALLRVIFGIISGNDKGGGSTLTQQLAKNTYFTQKKELIRKIAEVFMAFEYENELSKEEILELYINTCYYGDGYYSIADAADGYFDKKVEDMNTYEFTLLVGIPNAPSVYAPTKNPELAKERQFQVLSKMLDQGYITEEEVGRIKEEDYDYGK